MARKLLLYDRELSWISFNGRVLQEAGDPRVPLGERLKFLAIFSSNLDEFYRVRVAGLRRLARLGRRQREDLDVDAPRLLREIYARVDLQQQEFGKLFMSCRTELREHGVDLLDADDLSETRLIAAHRYYREHVEALLQPVLLRRASRETFLHNRQLYLIVELRPLRGRGATMLGRVTLPTETLPRFVTLPPEGGRTGVMFLDDLVRLHLPQAFPDHEVMDAHAVKLNRDADLHIDDEFTGDLVKKIRRALKRRETGVPARFLYDPQMPPRVLKRLRAFYDLQKDDLFPGGRYHNFHDLFALPLPDNPSLRDAPQPPLPAGALEESPSMFDAVRTRDHLLHFPYQRFDPVVRFLEEAAADPAVERIGITLYRVAARSRIADALIAAALAGKKVQVFLELKARFDEESNLAWSERMKEAGAQVLHSIPGLKVHAKLYLIVRRENGRKRRYAYLGTGNFNEKTATLYADHGLFTADESLTKEVDALLQILAKKRLAYEFEHLAVAQFNLRPAINRLIDREIRHAREGRPARVFMKLNSLEDPRIIRRLYRASRAGVEVRLIVRGICCLVPGVPELSENVAVTSVVDRYLEHARVYVFHNAGEEEVFLSSADMMRRNLNRRIEVMFPLRDGELRRVLRRILDLQEADTAKTRLINPEQDNPRRSADGPPLRSQEEIWRMLAGQRGADD